MQAYPDVECYRTIPVLNFDDLSEIFSHSIADGRYSLSSHNETFSNEELGECYFHCLISYYIYDCWKLMHCSLKNKIRMR